MLHTFNPNTLENLLQRNTTKSQIIYLIVLLAIVAAGITAYFVKVPITVQAQGIVRPLSERTEIKSNLSEKITALYIREGQTVQKGDTLLRLNTEKIEISIKQTQEEIDRQTAFIADLRLLLLNANNQSLKTPYYRAQQSSFRRRLFELESRLKTTTKNYERSKTLFSSGTIAPAEMEKDEQEYLSAVSEVDLYRFEQRMKWEDDMNRYSISLNELHSRLKQYHKEAGYYTLVAPVSGTIEQFSGVYVDNYVIAGNTIAIISPDASIQIECYIQPKDIGFIRLNDTARIQIGAFPYTEWGILKAKTVSISDDYHLVNNTPMFRVRCIPEKDYLSLRNGFTGKIKKGMTVQARFPVIERTVYQLLFDNINDWLNPAQQQPKSETQLSS